MAYIQRAPEDGRIIAVFREPPEGVSTEFVDQPPESIELGYPVDYERRWALVALRDAVSAARTKYAPNAAFQGPTYDIKAAEADAYVAAGRPADTSAFPLLAASAQANNRTVSAHADLVLAKRDAWIPLLAATEHIREAGENAIKAADTVEAINAARDAYVGQLAQI